MARKHFIKDDQPAVEEELAEIKQQNLMGIMKMVRELHEALGLAQTAETAVRSELADFSENNRRTARRAILDLHDLTNQIIDTLGELLWAEHDLFRDISIADDNKKREAEAKAKAKEREDAVLAEAQAIQSRRESEGRVI